MFEIYINNNKQWKVRHSERLIQIRLRNDKKREDELAKFGAQYIPQVIMKISTNYIKGGKLCAQ